MTAPDAPLPPGASAQDVQRMLSARYGSPGHSNRKTVAIVSLLAAALAAYLWWAFFVGANPAVTASLLTYDITSPSSVTVTFETKTRPGLQGPFTCVIRAQDDERIDVGYALFDVRPTNGAPRTIEWVLTTRRAAQFVEVLACDQGVERPAKAPAPQFPPGVLPPQQVAPGRAP